MAVTAKPERAADSAAALVETPAIRTRFIRRIPEGACVDVRKRGTALFRPHDHQKGAVPLFRDAPSQAPVGIDVLMRVRGALAQRPERSRTDDRAPSRLPHGCPAPRRARTSG